MSGIGKRDIVVENISDEKDIDQTSRIWLVSMFSVKKLSIDNKKRKRRGRPKNRWIFSSFNARKGKLVDETHNSDPIDGFREIQFGERSLSLSHLYKNDSRRWTGLKIEPLFLFAVVFCVEFSWAWVWTVERCGDEFSTSKLETNEDKTEQKSIKKIRFEKQKMLFVVFEISLNFTLCLAMDVSRDRETQRGRRDRGRARRKTPSVCREKRSHAWFIEKKNENVTTFVRNENFLFSFNRRGAWSSLRKKKLHWTKAFHRYFHIRINWPSPIEKTFPIVIVKIYRSQLISNENLFL